MANAFDEDRKRCEDEGMNGFISKPIDPAKLKVALGEWIPAPDFIKIALDESIETNQAVLPVTIIHVNQATGLRMCGGKVEFYHRMLSKFIAQNSIITQCIHDALHKGLTEEAERLAHTLKGLSGTFGLEEVQKLALSLEHKIKEHSPPDITDIQIAALQEELVLTIAEIRKILATNETDLI